MQMTHAVVDVNLPIVIAHFHFCLIQSQLSNMYRTVLHILGAWAEEYERRRRWRFATARTVKGAHQRPLPEKP